MIKNSILTILISFAFAVCKAQDTASVLFIGNSYTYVNDMPLLVENIANSLGDILNYDSQTAGGATFSTHAGNSATYTKINSASWDFVVLQAQSQEPSMAESIVNNNTLPFAEQIADSAYVNNFCSEVMMFMTWGRENGDPSWAPNSTFEGMNSRLRAAYIRMADSVQGSVSPVGSAWKYVRDNYPSINLYQADESHPSYEGSYLAACTFYASIYRKSPIGASFIGTLDALTASNLQLAASLTVMDSLDQWNLRPISEHTQANFDFVQNGNTIDFINLSTKATNYYWDFGDLNTSNDETPSNTYSTNGIYTVQLIAESPCDTDTIELVVNISNLGLNTNILDYRVKNLGNGTFEITNSDGIRNLELIDMKGRAVKFRRISSGNLMIDISDNEFGVYLLKFDGKNGIVKLPYFEN